MTCIAVLLLGGQAAKVWGTSVKLLDICTPAQLTAALLNRCAKVKVRCIPIVQIDGAGNAGSPSLTAESSLTEALCLVDYEDLNEQKAQYKCLSSLLGVNPQSLREPQSTLRLRRPVQGFLAVQ